MVVAKGKNYLALRIRQKAIEHQVPIIENPPLAQALYNRASRGRRFRRISTARWRRFWLTSTNL